MAGIRWSRACTVDTRHAVGAWHGGMSEVRGEYGAKASSIMEDALRDETCDVAEGFHIRKGRCGGSGQP
jgi:hypothetical protein